MATTGAGQRRVSADRHSGTAGGVAAPLEAANPLTVTVVVDPDAAHTRGAQLAAAMLCNILVRSIGSVTTTELACPPTPLMDGVLPGGRTGDDFTDAVVTACTAIGGERVTPADEARNPVARPNHFTVGIGNVDADITMVFGNWWGGLNTRATAPFDHDVRNVTLPFGAYAAAAHAGAEVFRRSRIPGSEPLTPYAHDLWNQRVTNHPGDLPADDWLPEQLRLDAALAGVGAVGTAWLATIWATPALTGDVLYADTDHVDDTNLNRCVLFNLATLGLLKTEAVEPLLTNAVNQLSWTRTDTLLQASDKLPFPVPLLASAVDENRARRDLQALNPQRSLAASTHNLRADLLRPGPPGHGACLLCHNPLEPDVPDREVRARWLAADPADKRQLAAAVGVTVEVLDTWARQARCGELDARALPVLADTFSAGPRQFSTAFLSVLAGVMLAAETVKEVGGVAAGLGEANNRAVIQTVTHGRRGTGPVVLPSIRTARSAVTTAGSLPGHAGTWHERRPRRCRELRTAEVGVGRGLRRGSGHADECQERSQRRQVDAGSSGGREHGLAGDERCGQE